MGYYGGYFSALEKWRQGRIICLTATVCYLLEAGL